MDLQITTFVSSLDIPVSRAHAVGQLLHVDSNVAAYLQGKDWVGSALINTACQLLKLIVGESKVVTKLIDQVIANENWSVLEPPKLR